MLADAFKERFVQHMFLISESFVTNLLAELLTREDCAAYQGIFFNHLIRTDSRLTTRDLGFVISRHVEHQGLGEVGLMARRKNEVLFIEPLFFKLPTDESRIPLLLRTLDGCYQDCTHRTLHLLTLRNRLDCYKGFGQAQGGRTPDSHERARIEFAFWDEMLTSFRDPSRQVKRASVSEPKTAGNVMNVGRQDYRQLISTKQHENYSKKENNA